MGEAFLQSAQVGTVLEAVARLQVDAARHRFGVVVLQQQAVDAAAPQTVQTGLADLRRESRTFSVRLIHPSICERLTCSPLTLCIQLYPLAPLTPQTSRPHCELLPSIIFMKTEKVFVRYKNLNEGAAYNAGQEREREPRGRGRYKKVYAEKTNRPREALRATL